MRNLCCRFVFLGFSVEVMQQLKQKIYERCLSVVEEHVARLQRQLDELKEGMESETKSTVGDKYETGRAMLQIEQDNVRRQLSEAMQQKAGLQVLDITHSHAHVVPGALVKTNKGLLFVATGLGKIQVDGENVFVLSPASPLGQKIEGLQKGDSAEVNGVRYMIELIN